MQSPNEGQLSPIVVCFVILDGYALFNPTCRHNFGGAEVRGHLFAQGLAQKKDFRVVVVVRDHGQPAIETYDGITVIAHPGYQARLDWRGRYRAALRGKVERTTKFPFFRVNSYDPSLLYKATALGAVRFSKLFSQFFRRHHPVVKINNFPVLPEKTAIYHQIQADLYCCMGPNAWCAEIAAYCQAAGKPSILFRAYTFANPATLDQYETYSIRHAACVIAQTNAQAEEMEQHFKIRASIVHNPIDTTLRKPPDPITDRKNVLWVGKSHAMKNPMPMLELAAAFPNTQFMMVMNCLDEAMFEQFMAKKSANITIHEHIPAEEIETCFAQARVFVNTSPAEGFPNTFLQAGKYHVPILSFHVDPNGMLTRHQGGIFAAGDFQQLVEGLTILLNDDAAATRYGENARQYVVQHHDLQRQIDALAEVLRAVRSSSAF